MEKKWTRTETKKSFLMIQWCTWRTSHSWQHLGQIHAWVVIFQHINQIFDFCRPWRQIRHNNFGWERVCDNATQSLALTWIWTYCLKNLWYCCCAWCWKSSKQASSTPWVYSPYISAVYSSCAEMIKNTTNWAYFTVHFTKSINTSIMYSTYHSLAANWCAWLHDRSQSEWDRPYHHFDHITTSPLYHSISSCILLNS